MIYGCIFENKFVFLIMFVRICWVFFILKGYVILCMSCFEEIYIRSWLSLLFFWGVEYILYKIVVKKFLFLKEK